MSSQVDLKFGETIFVYSIAKDLQDLAAILHNSKQSVYTLLQNHSYGETRKTNAVLVGTYKEHAVVLIIPARVCNRIFGSRPVVGARTDLDTIDAKSTVLHREETIVMYHVHLTNNYELGKKVFTSASTRSFDWSHAPKPYYFGRTKLPEQLLDVLAVLCLHDFKHLYRLTLQDCLEFAKRFACTIAKQENDCHDDDLNVICSALQVLDENASVSSRKSERKSRANWLLKGETAAFGNYLFFDPVRLAIAAAFIVMVIYVIMVFVR